MKHNRVHSRDSILQFWVASKFDFFTLEKAIGFSLESSDVTLAEFQLGFSEEASVHIISVYTIFDLFSFIGGVAIFVYAFFCFLLGPMASHTFFIRAIQRLYMVHLSDQSVLKRHQPRRKTMEELCSAQVSQNFCR